MQPGDNGEYGVGHPVVVSGEISPRPETTTGSPPPRSRLRRWAVRGACFAIAAPIVCVLAFFVLDACFPFPATLLKGPPPSPRLLAADVSDLQTQLAPDDQWRKPVPLDQISPTLIEATIAVEDQRFRQHMGVDPLAILRAAKQNALSGQTISGASTITMQLVKLLSGNRKRSLGIKAQEAFRALQLERIWTKDQILERYLNIAPYVGNHQGIESASMALFGKHALDLSQAEAYLLAGLPQSPTRFAPTRHPEKALWRRHNVLHAAVQTRTLDAASAQRLTETELTLNKAPRPDGAFHFSRMAFTQRPAGGTTTLDPILQARCQEFMQRRAVELPTDCDIALVAIEIETGAVRALIGSADPSDPIDGQVNGATAWRSPGSALKPFLYAAAFEAHLASPESLVDDSAMDLAGWTPQNFDGDFQGQVTVTEALRRSLNIPAMRLARQSGLSRCIGVLESSGVRFRAGAAHAAGLALATGAAEVRLIDLTNAYATLGRNGHHKPWILFEDEIDAKAPGAQVLSPSTCQDLHGILNTRHRFPNPKPGAHHFCWKTGTSSGFRDAWAMGHDAQYAVGIWVGNFSGTANPAFVGSHAATPLLTDLLMAE
ncbi:MAG: penicillin-binding protein 1C [Sulfitobacter sp.]|nr:penicillin-binding protein 1C [Sulfitobacter sp.]